MAYTYLILLYLMLGAALITVLKRPAKLFQFPYFMSLGFTAFIAPQALALARFSGGVRPESVDSVLLMSCLCFLACILGYSYKPKPAMCRMLITKINMSRLFAVGVIYILIGYVMAYYLNGLDVEFSTRGGMTGDGTILLFFGGLIYPGFAIALFCALKQATPTNVIASIAGFVPLVQIAANGRRESLAILVIAIALPAYFERRMVPPRAVIVGMIILVTLLIPATGQYRTLVARGEQGHAFELIDFLDQFEQSLSEESSLELRNGAAIIESVSQSGNFEYGRAYWNHVVFRFVPAQYLGADFKRNLMLDTWDVNTNGGTEHGIKFVVGSTITGMGDSFLQFGWLGWIVFAAMAALFRFLWEAAILPDGIMIRIFYTLTITTALRAVTHWTLDFIPGLLYYGLFVGIAAFAARAQRGRDKSLVGREGFTTGVTLGCESLR